MDKPYTEQGAELQPTLSMPADIEIIEYLGKGGRAYGFKAVLGQDSVVVKVYRKEVAQKYRDKYGVDIAEFEYQRNQALYELDDIKTYIAKPYRVHPLSSNYTHSIVQEYVTGKTLKALVAELGHLPNEILEAGYDIVKHTEAHGIHDLDISSGNIIVSRLDGKWRPKLYDFNLIPQHMFPPNPFLGLAIKLGLRGKSFRDYRNLKKWESRGKLAQNSANIC